MKISILTPDASNNCFGRAWLLAKLLQDRFDIEVIGPTFGNGIWMPLRDICDFPVKTVKGYHRGQFEFRKMLRAITGDIVYASKPLFPSFGVGLMKKLLNWKPLVLDIDDWELGFGNSFYDSLPWYKKINDFRLSFSNLRSYYYSIILDKFIPLANAVTVSGNILEKEYGGTVIWHGRDSNIFDPKKFNSDELKKKYLHVGDNAYIISFIGTPRSHKGLEDLIGAMEILNDKNIFLMIVGMDNSEYCSKLKARITSSIIRKKSLLFPEQPFEQLPEYLAISDLVVIPQRDTTSSHGQVPAKLFDAMAMAKPIISTGVFDIPYILEDCGWIVQNENPRDLAEKIYYVYLHPDEAIEKGLKAREKFIKQYSFNTLGKKLISVFKKLEN